MELLKTVKADIEARYGFEINGTPKNLSLGYANENYALPTSKGSVLFRLCKQQPLELIQFEVQLMSMLRTINYPTAYPIQDKKGQYIHAIGTSYWMLFEFKSGTAPDLNAEVASQMGEATGKLSVLPNALDLQKENAIHLNTCKTIIKELPKATVALGSIPEYYIAQTNYLEEVLPNNLPKGIVHGDLFPDNTLFQENQLVAIIDFEEACIDHLLFDLAMTINGFCFVDNTLNNGLLEAVIQGYEKHRKLTSEEWKALPDFIQWGAHGMLTWHLRNDLLYTDNPKQYKRVLELMERVKKLKEQNINFKAIL